jgi:hypothetical protein
MGSRCHSHLGQIHVFVSNAGLIEWEPITKITLNAEQTLPSTDRRCVRGR